MRWALILVVVGTTLFVAANATGSTLFGEGTFRVPQDVKPGTYRTKGGEGCYWARLKNFSGGLNSIIANGNASGPEVVTIKSTDRGFETNDCGNWTRNLGRITKSKIRFGEGTYIVRVDVAPGTYRSRGGDGCYWARLKNFEGGIGAIISNGNASGSAIVTIARTDRGFTSNDCATWVKVS